MKSLQFFVPIAACTLPPRVAVAQGLSGALVGRVMD
jgi:hypothetical protein